ncbi:MAG: hypothetical protein P9L91_07485 [Candidatus Zophobacter franzmannii]|nr:hypothetical protein [Candidatus Zophobacter franzmannii]
MNNRVKAMVLFLLFVMLHLSLYSLTQKDAELLRNNDEWFVGVGKNACEEEADKKAIKDLLSQITLQVSSSFKDVVTEENGSVDEYCSLAMETYSSARLDGAERCIFEKKREFIVYRYIKKEDRNRIFEGREVLIKDYAHRGHEAEEELRIGDALMNYYWSLVLLKTHPNWDRITVDFDDENETLITYLPDRIRRIYGLLELTVKDTRYDEKDELTLLTLYATFLGEPVRSLDLKYYLGSDWSVPVGATQGKALLEFLSPPEDIPSVLKLNILYNDTNKAGHNSDLRNVLQEMPSSYFRECRFEIPLKRTENKKKPSVQVSVDTIEKDLSLKPYKDLAEKIVASVETQDLSGLKQNLTPEGEKSFEALLLYGKARFLEKQITVDKIKDKVYLRGFPAQFSFPNSGRKFNEELVFIVNEDNQIEQVNFALSKQAIGDILGRVTATDTEKFQIVRFIEEYKTAYCTENVGFLEKVFDDNALIIVGMMLRNDNIEIDGMYKKLGKNWRAVQYSKKDYINKLKAVFSTNEYVNLHFEDNNVTRVNSDSTKVFGIQIHQYFYSQHYSDEGYLFLMFDLSDENKPKIYVRTWQPEKNPDGSIYGLEDFYLPSD